MIKAIIVDDEPLALDVLETYISQLPNIELVQKCTNAIEANEALKQHEIDLMFLDIQMPQITGIDFLKSLENPPKVIFTTAYPDYAVDGFELNASDYLLKPISLERFMKSVNRVSEEIELEQNEGGSNNAETDEFFFVKADKKLIKIIYSDILYIEGLKDYVIIRMNDSRVITLQTMKSLESKLPSNIFQRIHRSYIINIQRINAIIGNMVEITEKGEKRHIPVGKNYRERLLEIVNENRL